MVIDVHVHVFTILLHVLGYSEINVLFALKVALKLHVHVHIISIVIYYSLHLNNK